ncbi:hypothetical protein ACOMHN_014089 [Nucella lapillus]
MTSVFGQTHQLCRLPQRDTSALSGRPFAAPSRDYWLMMSRVIGFPVLVGPEQVAVFVESGLYRPAEKVKTSSSVRGAAPVALWP